MSGFFEEKEKAARRESAPLPAPSVALHPLLVERWCRLLSRGRHLNLVFFSPDVCDFFNAAVRQLYQTESKGKRPGQNTLMSPCECINQVNLFYREDLQFVCARLFWLFVSASWRDGLGVMCFYFFRDNPTSYNTVFVLQEHVPCIVSTLLFVTN